MKKIAIVLLLIISLSVLYACNSQSNQNEGDTTSAVSTGLNEDEKAKSSTEKNSKTTKKNESSTLESVEGDGESEGITMEFETDDPSTTKNSGKETTTKSSEEPTSPGSYELPIIPIPSRQ